MCVKLTIPKLFLSLFCLTLMPLLTTQAEEFQHVDVVNLVNQLPTTPLPANQLVKQAVKLAAPPFVHEHQQVDNGPAKVYQFTLPIIEKEWELDQAGTKIHALTFNGTVPGPLMVVHQGDYVELTLQNLPSNTMVHNIDFHAATGAMGGGDISKLNPGEQITIRWKATRAGVFVYHCAPGGPMTPWHVTQGMNGAVMVLPRDGLKDELGKPLRYDRVYYIGEQDFYVPQDKDGNYLTFATPAESMADSLTTMTKLIPSHVVFNGAVGALIGDKALKAKVGENILLVHSQANRDSRPHLIGGHGDYVWEQGKFNNPPTKDLETWFIRGGSAGAALYKFRQPGTYTYLNHNLIEAILLGAAAEIDVSGDKWDHDLLTIVEPISPIEQPATKK